MNWGEYMEKESWHNFKVLTRNLLDKTMKYLTQDSQCFNQDPLTDFKENYFLIPCKVNPWSDYFGNNIFIQLYLQ